MTKRGLLAGILLCCVPYVQAEERTMLILDASGSMWGQIDGRAKIDIAREVLKGVVADWPQDRPVGLVVYGHRQKDDCNDIETLIPIGEVDKTRINTAVAAVTPKGKTPLSAAVKQAAEALKYSEEKATVILISDGVETCKLDPCAVGAELERLGVGFTAHVIGFDVGQTQDQQGLRCLAENTGGLFIAAANADELKKALEQTAKAPTVQPAPPPDQRPEPPPRPSAKLSITPAEAIKGGEIEVAIVGDADLEKGGHIELFKVGQTVPVQRFCVYKNRKSGGYLNSRFRLPNAAGDFVVRLSTGDHRLQIAETPVTVVATDIKLLAPTQAAPGSKIEVRLEAPLGLKGRVFLYSQGGERQSANAYLREGSIENYKPMKIKLPELPGAYIFRFEASPDDKVMAEAAIQIGQGTQP